MNLASNAALVPVQSSNQTDRAHLKAYAEAIALWCARFDTAEIAGRLGVPEALIALWVANFRDLMRAT